MEEISLERNLALFVNNAMAAVVNFEAIRVRAVNFLIRKLARSSL